VGFAPILAFSAESEPWLGLLLGDNTCDGPTTLGNHEILARLLDLIEQLQSFRFKLGGGDCFHMTS
jgi:hypothetical protein